MAFIQAENNAYSWSEQTESDNQVTITNSSGRAYTAYEIVQEGRYVGEVREYGGIANGATGKINIIEDRKIRTAQIAVADTFIVGQLIYFLTGGAGAAGELRATPVAGSVVVGTCTGFGGTAGAHTYVEYRPFDQDGEASLGGSLKVLEVIIPTGSAAAPVVVTDIPVGSKIIDVEVRATVTNGSGAVTVSDGTNAITDAIIMAVINVMTKAGTIDQTYDTIIAAGLTFTAAGAADAGRAYVYYI